MRRALIIWCLLLAGIFCVAQQERVSAYWQSRDSNYNISVGGSPPPTYTGPLDLGITGVQFWYGLRCGSTSYTGDVVDIKDVATGLLETLVTCSAGGVLNTSSPNPLATTCASSCYPATLYDQSGASACSGPCNLTPTDTAGEISIALSAVGGKMCMLSDGTQYMFGATLSGSIAQPAGYSAYAERTGGFSATSVTLGNNATPQYGFGFGVANQAEIYINSGTILTTATDSQFHALQAQANISSSVLYVDGIPTSGSVAAGSLAGPIRLFNDQFNSFLTGYICEQGAWAGGFTPTQAGLLTTNQAGYY